MCSEARPRSSHQLRAGAAALALLWLAPWPLRAQEGSAAQDAEQGAPALLAPAAPSEVTQAKPSAPEPAPSAEETTQTRQARELTARAKERFDAGDFGAALVEFSRAYELLEHDPRRAELLNNIAVCHERMFRYDLALHYYERYLREGAADAADRVEVEAVIRGLRGLLGTLRISANVSSEIWIDDRPYGALSRDVLVPAGSHVIELRARAHEPARREVRVVPRTSQSLHFELTPLPQYHGVHRAYFWTGVGLTSAALVTGGALGLRALGEKKDAEALNEDSVAMVQHERKYQNLALASDLAWGASALFAVGSTVLFFLTDWRGRQRERDARPAERGVHVSFDPKLTPSSLGVAVRGGWR
jgi:tetratricopeptide (TPR) repeat protein